jgi:hypothetical protein
MFSISLDLLPMLSLVVQIPAYNVPFYFYTNFNNKTCLTLQRFSQLNNMHPKQKQTNVILIPIKTNKSTLFNVFVFEHLTNEITSSLKPFKLLHKPFHHKD